MKKEIKLWKKQEKRIVKLLYKKGFLKDFKIEGVEKIQCIPENQNSKIFTCDLLIKYEVLTSQNSLSELVGFSGKKSEIKKIKIFKGSSGWEIIG